MKLKPLTKFGGFTGTYFNTITLFNGWEPKSDPLWDTKLKDPMLGWMVNKVKKDSGSTNSSPTNFINTLINSCLETFFSPSLLSWRKMLSLGFKDLWHHLADQFYCNWSNLEIFTKSSSNLLYFPMNKQMGKFSLTLFQEFLYFWEEVQLILCGHLQEF